MYDDFDPDTASSALIVDSSAGEGEVAGWVPGVGRTGSGVGVEVEDVGSPLSGVGPNLGKGQMVQDQPLEALTRGQTRPIADREGHQPLQLDKAEGERLVAPVGRYAGSACPWTDHCCGAMRGVP